MIKDSMRNREYEVGTLCGRIFVIDYWAPERIGLGTMIVDCLVEDIRMGKTFEGHWKDSTKLVAMTFPSGVSYIELA